VKEKIPRLRSFEEKTFMKKIILINGLIAGVIVSSMFFITKPFMDKGYIDFDNGMVVGYASMLIALSMIYFGVKSHRDRNLNGTISFGKALAMGLLITAVAGVIYASVWDVYFRFYDDNFLAKYTEHTVKKMQENGATPEQIATARLEAKDFDQLYQNFFVRFGFTLMEIFPVGLLISLVTAGIVRKKSNGQPAVIS
jgi:hypothetical protein